MKRIQYMITGLCWVVWLSVYIALAAWVLQDADVNAGTRFSAALIGLYWLMLGGFPIHATSLPQAITKALFEDEGR